MNKKSPKQNEHFRDIVDPYLSKWKMILLCIVFALALAFVFLRYATYQYKATATIQIKDDRQTTKLPELSSLQNYGLFKKDLNNVLDETEIIGSRTLVEEAVKSLKFNIQYFVEGRIQKYEVYNNPPLILNFSATDSVLFLTDTIMNVKIQSETQFLLKGITEKEKFYKSKVKNIEDQGTLHSFGKPIKTGFGDVIITPGDNPEGKRIGANITIKITPINKVTSHYKKNLEIETKEYSTIINLAIKDNSLEKATLFLNKLIEVYNQDVVNDKEKVVEVTSDFINSRLEIVSKELGEVDLTAETIQKRNRLSDLATQSNIFLQNERDNESQIIKTTNQIQLIDYMKEFVDENNDTSDLLPSNIGIEETSISEITRRHNDLVIERNRLLKHSSEKNPTVVNLTNQINELKGNLNQNLNNIKSSNKITLSTLSEKANKISGQIYTTPTKERQFRDTQRQQSIKESLYLYLLQKREEAAISHGISSPNAKLVDSGFASSKPVTPVPIIVYLSAFILGASFPIGLIYLANLLDSKVHTIKDIKMNIDVPYLGDIPRSNNRKKLIEKVDYSAKAEAFRIARTNIDFMLQGITDRAKTIFVTSTTSKEGKSHTSINLALSLSFSEKKVLLIETDIRVPKATNYLKIKNEIGITNYIGNPQLKVEDVITAHPDNEFLDVIPSGVIPPNPSELLMSKRVGELFEAVKPKYDYIIVDTAAVGLVTDTLLISQYADMFVYVVRANYIDKRQLHIAQTMYTEKRLPNMAILLNAVNQKKSGSYTYGYGNNPKDKKWWKFA
ncbi:polysaccharide biosynthesis tyrosine autokinase [Oceanihabitans sediminis]|uniref:non-specific protein-tyrosine kinase n=1 Tax=Oceanihabitans sediminis TaxID=1812012 RepID=A0A368P885_9FLAO|nr:polysaccharide biosynthesis tyrosine autokinase [Oceanihabitans sediminis]MDX1277181.1 polysaccharide biosynthesis tyrosine autokinase [Oceanihabitans sediminis]MDX1773599.1 polysaccharide biosynthesis tyrosine autokinase [Oceanihabitans sediminis]RBP33043.1 capsular exopolysaccharide synthesis family protein [Oceanihabitans sediminis]RCU57441.1 tyrosine protein kinase [Oceanihabitans sediminis]